MVLIDFASYLPALERYLNRFRVDVRKEKRYIEKKEISKSTKGEG